MMTYEQYRLLKRITKHSGKEESFYIRHYGKKIKSIFDKAREADFVDYETIGFKRWDAAYGIQREYNKVWMICDSGEKAFDEYKEHRRDLWSGRIFSIIVSVIAAALSFAGSVAFYFFFPSGGNGKP